jgi:Tol biopolymer transport system component
MRSFLEIFDLESGVSATLHETAALIEAPNWSPCGGWLLVNGDGRLSRIDLDDPDTLKPIEATGLSRLNNDHGFAPDGSWIAISDHTEHARSCIYIVSSHGGKPRRMTPKVPSWWHGWSPDGREIAYVAVRGPDRFGIYVMPAVGGEERLVAGGDGPHYDGPDYTPDGQWIWFNSDRGGVMQLWRAPLAGGGPQQMTHDDRVNWFPHPSPDGRHVLYLSYEPGTQGHPRDRDVELRLMDAAGGEPRTLLRLYGGQGTINVPCWAPDSRRFAYVRYARPA